MRFIKTDRGDYVSVASVQRVEREPLERGSSRPDDGIRKFNLYDRSDELLGSVRVTEERMDLLLAELIPAQSAQKLITLHFDEENRSVFQCEYRIVAWAFEPGALGPSPITTEGNVYAERGIGILIEMPDGKFDEPYVAIHDSLDTAKAEFLKARMREQAAG